MTTTKSCLVTDSQLIIYPLSPIIYQLIKPFVKFIHKVISCHINRGRSDSNIAICQSPMIILLIFKLVVGKFAGQPEIIRIAQTRASSPLVRPTPFGLFTNLYSFYIGCIREIYVQAGQRRKSFSSTMAAILRI